MPPSSIIALPAALQGGFLNDEAGYNQRNVVSWRIVGSRLVLQLATSYRGRATGAFFLIGPCLSAAWLGNWRPLMAHVNTPMEMAILVSVCALGWSLLTFWLLRYRRVTFDAERQVIEFYSRAFPRLLYELPWDEVERYNVSRKKRRSASEGDYNYSGYSFRMKLMSGVNLKLFETGSLDQANAFGKLVSELSGKPFTPGEASSVASN